MFFAVAPAVGYPLDYGDAINLLKILAPIFSGYLGSAVVFFSVRGDRGVEEPSSKMLELLAKWPVYVFGVGIISVLAAFPISHIREFDGKGMTPNVLSLLVSLLTALLAATTGAISAYLFKVNLPLSDNIADHHSNKTAEPYNEKGLDQGASLGVSEGSKIH